MGAHPGAHPRPRFGCGIARWTAGIVRWWNPEGAGVVQEIAHVYAEVGLTSLERPYVLPEITAHSALGVGMNGLDHSDGPYGPGTLKCSLSDLSHW